MRASRPGKASMSFVPSTPTGGKHAGVAQPSPGTPSTVDSDDENYNDDLAHTSFDSENEKVVPYDKGATDLFLAIEECEWEKALQIARNHPHLAKVWVASTGSENTAFSWNLWRRLPIHEACRRQPPPLLISELLSVYPESACHTTHFGELPVHLAVGCGACPAVVDLLLASNFHGANVADSGGRTPLEILDDLQLREDSQVIKESLERCVIMLDRERAAVDRQMQKLREEHKTKVAEMQRGHDRQLAMKDDTIASLEMEVERGNEKATDLSAQIDERDSKIADKTRNERTLMEQLRKLEDDVSDLMGKNRNLRGRIGDLDDTVMKNEATIAKLRSRVDDLEEDLATELFTQEQTIGEELTRAEVEVAMLLKTQRELAGKLKRQRDAFKKKLGERGVALPEPITTALNDSLLDSSCEEDELDAAAAQSEGAVDRYSKEEAAQAATNAAAKYLEQDYLDITVD